MKWRFWEKIIEEKLERANQKRFLLQEKFDKKSVELRKAISIDLDNEEKNKCYEMWKSVRPMLVAGYWENWKLQETEEKVSAHISAKVEVYGNVLKLMGIWTHNQGVFFMIEKKRLIQNFDGGYGRIGNVWVEINKCGICGIEKTCITSDGSGGEYDNVYLCADCVKTECDKGISGGRA